MPRAHFYPNLVGHGETSRSVSYIGVFKIHSGSCDNKLEVKLEMISEIVWYSLGFNLPGRSRESYKVLLVALLLANCSYLGLAIYMLVSQSLAYTRRLVVLENPAQSLNLIRQIIHYSMHCLESQCSDFG